MSASTESQFDVIKDYKQLYNPKAGEPQVVTVPSFPFFMIDGEGDPNTSESFKRAVQALYSLSYAIKMLPKKGIIPQGYLPYKIPPLEGLWRIKEGTRFSYEQKYNWEWTLMFLQPPFVDNDLLLQAQEIVKPKKNHDTDKVRLEQYEEGVCIQVLHVGPYSTEPESMARMEQLAAEQSFSRLHGHHEVYLSNPGKVAPEKQRTILRFQIYKSQQ